MLNNNLTNKKILVTGGAGFIGSHLVNSLVSKGSQVTVFDNLSNGSLSNLSNHETRKKICFMKGDLCNSFEIKHTINNIDTVFHLAANSNVRIKNTDSFISIMNDIKNTSRLLESILNSKVEKIVYASSSTVYGEPSILPTNENYNPIAPISYYGLSKQISEQLILSFCKKYGIQCLVFRLGNVVGRKANHGVVYDFVQKLGKNQNELNILGDGKQSKSYIHVSDCIDCFLYCLGKNIKTTEIFNLSSNDSLDVMSIAKIIIQKMKLKNVKIFTENNNDGRGWPGDVKKMYLDIKKIKTFGWTPKLNSRKSIEKASEELIKEMMVPLVERR